jgi:hypothetical protein
MASPVSSDPLAVRFPCDLREVIVIRIGTALAHVIIECYRREWRKKA